ncbi:YbaB/EbfC family nucleoid-associated protein [Streptosporangium sp. NBC_01639]|uniref:YbaB/EbfC family nucleoid-associated protein n=1 Tax=Streptosporangium sp. NBC_01639 TaxID=2975948 RepID=UPI00386FB145|nr:YbaB/EbfC family nucleoid-associated protein [Streptosporangium sp. NBC_01639]
MEQPRWNDDLDIDVQLARLNEEVRSVRLGLAEIEGRAEAAKGLVAVRVGADCRIRDITLDPRVMRLPSTELAEAIKEAANTAADQVAGRAREITAVLTGEAPEGPTR